MNEEETPFAHIPTPGITERPSPYVPEGQIAFFGAVAQGLGNRSAVLRIAVVAFVVGLTLMGLIVALVAD